MAIHKTLKVLLRYGFSDVIVTEEESNNEEIRIVPGDMYFVGYEDEEGKECNEDGVYLEQGYTTEEDIEVVITREILSAIDEALEQFGSSNFDPDDTMGLIEFLDKLRPCSADEIISVFRKVVEHKYGEQVIESLLGGLDSHPEFTKIVNADERFYY